MQLTTSNLGIAVLFEMCIENCVTDLVTDFVWQHKPGLKVTEQQRWPQRQTARSLT